MRHAGRLMSCALALSCISAMAVDSPPDGASAAPISKGQVSSRVDNTDINQRDRTGSTKTPQDQSDRPQDRRLLAAIRDAIVGEKSLSTMAHNVKILVTEGSVTLRGPVRSEEEKVFVQSLAKQVQGVTRIDNQLDVKK